MLLQLLEGMDLRYSPHWKHPHGYDLSGNKQDAQEEFRQELLEREGFRRHEIFQPPHCLSLPITHSRLWLRCLCPFADRAPEPPAPYLA